MSRYDSENLREYLPWGKEDFVKSITNTMPDARPVSELDLVEILICDLCRKAERARLMPRTYAKRLAADGDIVAAWTLKRMDEEMNKLRPRRPWNRDY
jgi:hypothetical protein